MWDATTAATIHGSGQCVFGVPPDLPVLGVGVRGVDPLRRDEVIGERHAGEADLLGLGAEGHEILALR